MPKKPKSLKSSRLPRKQKKKASKNTGKAYEAFVREVLAAVHKLEGIRTTGVKPSKVFDGETLKKNGRPMKHQIDVHWEFLIGNQPYTAVVQAKDWGYRVPMKEMIAFSTIVDDIQSANTTGKFIARSGYQKGAIEWAEAKGVDASELRHPHKPEREGRLEGFQITFKASSQIFLNTSFGEDLSLWANSLDASQKLILNSKTVAIDANELPVEDATGKALGVLTDLIKCDANCGGAEDSAHLHSQTFIPPVFFVLFPALPKVKLTRLTTQSNPLLIDETVAVHVPLTHILRSVTGNQSYFVSEGKDGKLFVKQADNLPPIPKPRPESSW